MEHALQSRPRIEVVDALRGFAVMAIILLHNIEHFNLYNFPEATTDFMKALDKGVWDTLFFLFSGKAYAIFALLFGFSFFIQFDNQARKGKDFRLRFFWRLVLLFFIGCFNASFFPGEILVLYSILGIVLIPVCKLSNKVVLAIAVVLMLQPMEWGKFMYALMHPEYVASKEQWLVHCMRIYPYMEGTSFWEMVKSNLWDGQLYSLLGLELWTFLPDIGSLYAGHVVGAQGIVCRSGEAPDVLDKDLCYRGSLFHSPLLSVPFPTRFAGAYRRASPDEHDRVFLA